MTSLYYDIAKYISTTVIDVDFDWKYENGDLDIDIHIKVPIASLFESPKEKNVKSSG